jgi:Zn-dependent protease
MQSNILLEIATWLVPLVVAIVFHEVAHGLVAKKLGDTTAEERGRLTLNPIKHIDPFGTVILPLLLAISHAPVFGWARPVPVNYARLRNPRRDMVLVALAGPGMNLLLALVGAIVLAATLSLSSDPNSFATGLILAIRFRQIGRYSLLVLMLLLLVLPAISPSANIVGRIVSPLVDHIATGLLSIFGIRL